MPRWAPLLALCACAAAPVKPAGDTHVAATVAPCTSSTVTVTRDRTVPCIPPRIAWVPRECPPQFGACLSGEDSAKLRAYLDRCSDGR